MNEQAMRPAGLPPALPGPPRLPGPFSASGPPPLRTAAPHRLETIDGGFLPLILRGHLLTVISLGLYRFWYRTALRRLYWSRTRVAGSGFEYTGSPKELLIGFLVALAVVVPIYVAGFTASFLLIDQGGEAVTLVLAALFGLLIQFGAYRSRRYRLSRTLWRGVRFRQDGSAVTYALISFGWSFVVSLSLGLAFPWARAALEEYKVRHSHFGDAHGEFSCRIGALFLRFALFWLWLVIAIAGVFGALVAAAALDGTGGSGVRNAIVSGLLVAAWVAIAALVGFVLWTLYRVAEFRTFTNGSRIGPVWFNTSVTFWRVLPLYLVFGLITVVVGAAVLAAAGGALLALQGAGVDIANQPVAVAAVAMPAYLVFFILWSSAREYVLGRGLWLRMFGAIDVFNLEAIAGVTARPEDDNSAVGEGLADALDFGGV